MVQSRKNPDWSTIDLGKLRLRPVYKIPPTYHLQHDPGNGCFGDPPGFPSYFTRSVYNQYGNSPRNAPQYVILHEGVARVVVSKEADYETWDALLAWLWKPLPESHPRVQAWEQETYAHQQHMYMDDEAVYQQKGSTSYNSRWNSFVFPVPYYKLRHFHDDPRFSEEWRTTKKASIERENAEIKALAAKIATPENHAAVRIIQKFYPEHKIRLDWIENPPEHPGNWWETSAFCPSAEDCPGQQSEAAISALESAIESLSEVEELGSKIDESFNYLEEAEQ